MRIRLSIQLDVTREQDPEPEQHAHPDTHADTETVSSVKPPELQLGFRSTD